MTVSLTVSDLFQPAASGVGPFGQTSTPAPGSWLSVMLQIATTVQLPTTAWQPGGPERTILAIEAVTFSQSDADISVMAQGAFLDPAASGTVTYVDVDGTSTTIAVTPDPSNPAQNPSGAIGWLDLNTQNTYDVYRLAATYATGPLAFANLGATTLNYATGTYHAGNAQNGATYTNPAALSIPTSAIPGTGGQIATIAGGVPFTIIGTVSAHGLSVGSVVYIVVPQAAGISGLNSVFGLVTAVTTTTFQVQLSSSGTFVPSVGGTVYACTLANMVADVLGIGSNAAPGAVTVAITQNANLFISNAIGWSGSNWESNAALVNRTRLYLAAVSPNGPSQAYQFFAETAGAILAGTYEPIPLPTGQAPYYLTNGSVAATVYSNVATGIVTTVVASSTPASETIGANVTPGVAQLLVSGVTNANPCVVTCGASTSLAPGQSMSVIITGVLGTAGVNGTFLATYVAGNQFSIPIDTTLSGAYTGGGSVEGGDLGEIDALIQEYVVPDGIVAAITVSAQALPIVVVATISVPQAYVATYKISALQQLQAQISSYPIGGETGVNAVPYDDIVGALEEAGVLVLGQVSYVRQINSLSLNGGGVGVGVAFPANTYVAILSPPVLNIVGV